MRIVRNLTAAVAVVLLTVAGIATAVADDPPPRIAFLANGIVPADALAAGPIAGQLGAPIFTTAPDALVESTETALTAYAPELVIVMGGPVAISDAVLGSVAAATGLTVVPASPPPASGIVRAAGQDRFQTAAAAAALLVAYDPAYLPTDMKAIDSDKLDGMNSTAFQPAGDYLGRTAKAADADRLDGADSSAFAHRSGSLRWIDRDTRTNMIDLDDSHPDTVLAKVTTTLPNECTGTTTHRLLIDLQANLLSGPGTPGEPYGGLAAMRVNEALDIVAGAVGVRGLVGETDPARGQRSATGVVTLGPGSHTLELVDLQAFREPGDVTVRYATRTLVVTHAGWICS